MHFTILNLQEKTMYTQKRQNYTFANKTKSDVIPISTLIIPK